MNTSSQFEFCWSLRDHITVRRHSAMSESQSEFCWSLRDHHYNYETIRKNVSIRVLLEFERSIINNKIERL